MDALIPLQGNDKNPQTPFTELIEVAKRSVAPSSARVYTQTFKLWNSWAIANNLNPFNMTYANVATFLEQSSGTKSTKQRQLSALRSLLRMLIALDYSNPEWNALYQGLKLLKLSRVSSSGQERERRALSPESVWKVLAIWDGSMLVNCRNRALLCVLFYVGLRRSEVVELKWSDINLQDGVIRVRYGKGEQERETTIVGDRTIQALEEWMNKQNNASDYQRIYVFCSLEKGNKLGADRPMTTHAIWKMVKATASECGVDFSPHDARRTLATELLSENAPLADVQSQLGHKREATTLRYAQPAAAKARRSRLKTRY